MLLLASIAHAESDAVRLELVRDVDGCPDDRALKAAVTRRLGYDPFQEEAATHLFTRIVAHGGGLQASVVLRDGAGRVLGKRLVRSTSADCVELASALVLAISIVLDPPRVPAPPPRPPAPALAIEGLLFAHGALGAAPATVLGVGAGAALSRADRSLGLELRMDLPRSEEVSGGSVRTYAVMGLLSGCARFRALGVCGVAGGGALRASGEGFVETNAATRPVLLVGPRLLAEIPIGDTFSLSAHADALVSLVQTTLRVRDWSWTTPVFSGVLAVGLAARFH